MHIRRAKIADAEAVAEVAAATFVETFGHLYPPEDLQAYLLASQTPARYRELIGEPTTAIWIAQNEDGRLMGYAVAGACKLPVQNLEPDAGELRQLYVRAAVQNQQLGSNLFAAAMRWLAEQKREPIYIGVWSRNSGAQRFYARHGFTRVGQYDFPVGKQRDVEFILKRAPARLMRHR